METLLRKYLSVIDLAVIAICALLGARATATLIETRVTRIALPIPVRAVSRAPEVTSARSSYGKGADEILERNIFCSSCPPIGTDPLGTISGPSPSSDVRRTSLPLRLLAVMFAPPPSDPRLSIAVIRDIDDKSVGPYSVGSKIREAIVSRIDQVRLYLEVSGRLEYLDLINSPPLDPPLHPPLHRTTAPMSRAPTAAARDPVMAELDRGIKKIGEHSYEIQRQTVDSLLGDMTLLSRSVRVVPEIRDGKAAGFRLLSVRPDGPIARIGLQDGDVISAINGLEMTSSEKALEAYTKVRSASHLSLGLERSNGQRISIEYNIR